MAAFENKRLVSPNRCINILLLNWKFFVMWINIIRQKKVFIQIHRKSSNWFFIASLKNAGKIIQIDDITIMCPFSFRDNWILWEFQRLPWRRRSYSTILLLCLFQWTIVLLESNYSGSSAEALKTLKQRLKFICIFNSFSIDHYKSPV